MPMFSVIEVGSGGGGSGSVEEDKDGGVTENGKILNVVLVCPQVKKLRIRNHLTK